MTNNNLHIPLRHWSLRYSNLIFLTTKYFFKSVLVKFVVVLHFMFKKQYLSKISVRENLWSISWSLWTCFMISVKVKFCNPGVYSAVEKLLALFFYNPISSNVHCLLTLPHFRKALSCRRKRHVPAKHWSHSNKKCGLILQEMISEMNSNPRS
jgi:hypothetical protein